MIDRKDAIRTAKAVAINYNNLIDSAEREADKLEREADKLEREADKLEREADKLEREVNKEKRNSPSSNSTEETFAALVLIGISAALFFIWDKFLNKNN